MTRCIDEERSRVNQRRSFEVDVWVREMVVLRQAWSHPMLSGLVGRYCRVLFLGLGPVKR